MSLWIIPAAICMAASIVAFANGDADAATMDIVVTLLCLLLAKRS